MTSHPEVIRFCRNIYSSVFALFTALTGAEGRALVWDAAAYEGVLCGQHSHVPFSSLNDLNYDDLARSELLT